jgi:hypothetical protein
MASTNLHFFNNTTDVTSNQILIFLQPTGALDNYKFSAWNVLNPSIGSAQQAVLTSHFSGSVAAFGDSTGDYTRPVVLQLGLPQLVTNPNNQSPVIGGASSSTISPTQVGLDNECNTPNTNLSITWYVNGNKVVETNNTPTTTLNQGFEATFELTPSIYVMLAQAPTVTQTYTLQSFGKMAAFPVAVSATDLYFEVATVNGIDSVQSISQADYDKLVNGGKQRRADRAAGYREAAKQLSRSASVYAAK